jgi:hypothetical protein
LIKKPETEIRVTNWRVSGFAMTEIYYLDVYSSEQIELNTLKIIDFGLMTITEHELKKFLWDGRANSPPHL